ncbi:MAG: CPA2 family monovalent cation:H+ antiporter-2 [Enterobacterales bacterium]|jgi:CPA2 family monovalent cation:H+ antiporter-2
MHLDPMLPVVVAIALIVILAALLLRLIRQPTVLAYLLAGIVIGPEGVGLINDNALIEHMGTFGVILLLFFVGMEVQPSQLKKHWKISAAGTALQIVVSVTCLFIVGYYFQWSLGRIVLLGFVISLSSTAVVLKLLQEGNELDTSMGQKVLGILLAQDLAIVPMIIILGLLSDAIIDTHIIGLQLVGGIAALIFVNWLMRKPLLHLPFARLIQQDHELQVFAALIICFGLSLLTGLMQLSTALGAFIAGMLVAKTKETLWVKQSLEPFRVVFIALFFMSIGMLINLNFVMQQWWQLLILLVLVLITNTFINAISLRLLNVNWRDSLYSGALLAQLGEFSFVLASIGLQANLITQYAHQMTIAVIVLSLFVSPLWIALFKRITQIKH